MADKEKYLIKIQGKLIEVSEDVYYAYFRMERQERWQEEKKQEHEVVSYDATVLSARPCVREQKRVLRLWHLST